jgi:hypothetical protein
MCVRMCVLVFSMCAYVYMCMCVRAHVRVCLHIYHVCICVCMCVCVCVCVCVRARLHKLRTYIEMFVAVHTLGKGGLACFFVCYCHSAIACAHVCTHNTQ